MAGRRGLRLSNSSSQLDPLDVEANLHRFWEEKREDQCNLDGVDLEQMSMFIGVDPSIEQYMENLGRNPEDKSLQRAVYLLMLDECLNRFKEDPAAWQVLADFMAAPGQSTEIRSILENMRRDYVDTRKKPAEPAVKKKKRIEARRDVVVAGTKEAMAMSKSFGRRFKTQPAGPRQVPRTIRRGENGNWFMLNR